jgi:hypothetical protein
MAKKTKDEPRAARDLLTPLTVRFAACCGAVFAEDELGELGELEIVDEMIITLEAFVLANPEAPHVAMLMEVKRKHQAVLLPNADPRKLQLALKLFREAVLGLNAMQRQDDEAELARIRAEEQAARPVPARRDDERTMLPADHDFAPSDLAKSLPAA